MSTKQSTEYSFSPQGTSAYTSMMPNMTNVLNSFMQNPLQNSFFWQNQQMANKSIGQQGATQAGAAANNANIMGYGNMPGYMMSQLGAISRNTTGQQANAFISNLQNMTQNRLQAANMASNFKPYMTGQTTSMSGTGTWLPSLISGGLGLATMGMGGGGFGGLGKGMSSGANYNDMMSFTPNSAAFGGGGGGGWGSFGGGYGGNNSVWGGLNSNMLFPGMYGATGVTSN